MRLSRLGLIVFFALLTLGANATDPDHIYLTNSRINAGISLRWGGAIDSFYYISPTGTQTNLVMGADRGFLLQGDCRHMNNNWPTYDTTGLSANWEMWEGVNALGPACLTTGDPFVWNPTQAGSYTSCGVENPFDSPDDISPGPAGQTSSPVHYRIKFYPFWPLETLYWSNPSTMYRPNMIEDATVSLITSHASDVGVLKIAAQYKIKKLDNNGQPQSNYSEIALLEDRAFHTTSTLSHVYVYDPNVTTDCYGSKDITSNICSKANPCADFGWRSTMGETKWAPYVVLSSTQGGNTIWMVVYNTQDSPPVGNGGYQYFQARRRLINTYSWNGYNGFWVAFLTPFYSGVLNTDNWTPTLNNYYIVGNSYGHVMQELWYLSGGLYPKKYNASCASCSSFPCVQ